VTGKTYRRLALRIHGRVQGVGFRAFAARAARARALSGSVRNRRDGTVEAELIGPAADVEAVLAACRRGPPAAAVTKVEVLADEDTAAPPGGFTILPDQ